MNAKRAGVHDRARHATGEERPGAAPAGAAAETVRLKDLFARYLSAPVRLRLFTSRRAPLSGEQQRLLEEIAAASEQLSLEVSDLEADAAAAARESVEAAPCTIVRGARDYGIRFYGLSGGYEAATLIQAILMVGSAQSGLNPTLERWVRRIEAPARIEVFVTLTCPYCPGMVHVALQAAIANERVRVEVVDTAEFPERARAYGRRGVPFFVVNDRLAFEGVLAPEEVVLEVLRIAAPEAYEELEAELRSRAGSRRVLAPQPARLYDVLVVGAGPAAFSAAIYAVRKGLDVLLVGDRLGGQVADTALIENWPGAEHIGGLDLALAFRAHAEHYPISEQLRARVAAVERDGAAFRVRLEEGTQYRSRAVVYCAGKRYRTLGVPGEDRFLGRGISFCATCDAPLFQGKRVLVVGGGNSAYTAARDLLAHAREIHLVNVEPGWQADAVLQAQVARDPKVTLHAATRVTEFLGDGELSGARLEGVDGGSPRLLSVDGVFLEIGLVPNSAPVAALVALNARGEIVVNRDQSTAVPGFFAAGDVTDEPEKQIVVAEAAGAKAALAAHAYLASTPRPETATAEQRRETASSGEPSPSGAGDGPR